MRLSLPHSRFSETPLYQVVLSSPYSTICVIVWGFQPRAHLRCASFHSYLHGFAAGDADYIDAGAEPACGYSPAIEVKYLAPLG